MKAPVNRIIPFSNVDGPGNRCAIFLQGCPFHCLYCHNPETINECINCGACIDTCPEHALSMVDGKVVWDESKCVQCDTCIHVCPHLASPKIKMMSVKEVMKEIDKVADYIEGITISGGECMEHADFLLELFRAFKQKYPHKTSLLDSNGAHDFSKYPDLMQVCDGVMLDVKATNAHFHEWLCGRDNVVVLNNLNWLQDHNLLYEVRTVCLPNEDKQNENTVKQVSEVLAKNIRYKLIKYRPFGVRQEGLDKCSKQITTDEQITHLAKIAQKNGLTKVVVV